jgi:ABC-type uncharacterized transport system ATPase subunit
MQSASHPGKKHQDNSGVLEVQMSGICKRFPGVIANQEVNLNIKGGQVHALLGENGAGKTTIMNILSGLYRPDAGTISIEGREVTFSSQSDAIATGIGMVHQHFRLVENMTAAENIHLGWHDTPPYISLTQLVDRTENICKEHGLYIDPLAKIWQLSVGEQQRVEILRVLARKARVLILDEPTAVLTPGETKELFAVMRSLASEGKTVVFITHKLAEVMDVSDRVSVLRKGRNVASLDTSECDLNLLAQLMIGREVKFQKPKKMAPIGQPVLEICHASAQSDRGLPALKDISLSLQAGEILGIAGVAGNGQTELTEVLAGMRQLTKGKIMLGGKTVTGYSPAQMTLAGLGHIPEDRSNIGLILDLEIMDNAILREYRKPPLANGFLQVKHAITSFSETLVKQAKVVVPSMEVPVRHLSGGNQQRLLVGRETRIASKVLIAVHPTRGLDVGATQEVRQALINHRDKEAAILLVSEDLDELLMISDRIAVMYDGRLVGEFSRENADKQEIGLLMGGRLSSRNQTGDTTDESIP